MSEIVKTPKTPYYAVIFTSIRTPGDNGYEKVADEIVNIVSKQNGFLGAESVRDEKGFGMTISYWDSLDSINGWKNNGPHIEPRKWERKYGIQNI